MIRHPAFRYTIGAACVALLYLLPVLNLQLPGVLPGPTYSSGSLHLLAMAALMGAVALSYHLLLGLSGMLSFGHALYFGAGLYVLAMLLAHVQVGLFTAMAVTFAAVLVLASVLGAVSLRVTGIPFAMVTLAFAHAAYVLVRRNPGGLTGGEESLSLNTSGVPDFLVGVANTRNLYWIALTVLIVVYLVVAWVQSSRVGHVAAAARENDQRVRVLGLTPYVAKLLVFVIAGTIAGVVGMVYLLLQSTAVPHHLSADMTISILVMVVLGGVGSRWGALFGGVLYLLLSQRLSTLANSEVISGLPAVIRIPLSEPMFILGVLFILVVLYAPGGLAGLATRRVRPKPTDTKGPQAIEKLAGEEKLS